MQPPTDQKPFSPQLLVVFALLAIFCLLAIRFDLFARILSLALPVDISSHGHLDEYVSLFFLLSISYATVARYKYLELALECNRRKQAEEAFRESEERFRLVFDQSTDGIMLAEPDSGKVLYVNSTLEKLLGYSGEELRASGAALLYRHFAAENLELLFCQDDFMCTRVSSCNKLGEALVVSMRIKSVRICDRRLVHFSLRDMTEKARYEEQTMKSQARLIHANKMSSLGLLVSGVAHEINNPNSFIMFNSSMLADIWQDAIRILDIHYQSRGNFALGGLPYPEIGDATRKLIDGICEGAQRIKATVDDLKDFARQDDSGLDHELDLNQAILKAVSIMTPQIKMHCEHFSLNLAEPLPVIRGNLQQIEQVMMNLLSNALQSLPDRQCAVNIATAVSAQGRLLATVADQGIGMSRETMSRLFEPFFTTKSDQAGSGLGLYISQSIIREHGGLLRFESEPGTGTSAIVELPLPRPKGSA